jgi:CTP synthase (UTP-ammonia lyase)
VGQEQRVRLVPGTKAAALYADADPIEDYRCNYGVDSRFHPALEQAGLRLSGFGDDGELRIAEIAAHPFFIATLYVPQMRSAPDRPHPILAGFADAVRAEAAARSTAADRRR